ncbi:hypothetical protein BC835DRAFT_1372482 [Cytidiella melzeri]|nr:hypothetical protein BC835DRAFT_1372482 [Cytidiella melzeri]
MHSSNAGSAFCSKYWCPFVVPIGHTSISRSWRMHSHPYDHGHCGQHHWWCHAYVYSPYSPTTSLTIIPQRGSLVAHRLARFQCERIVPEPRKDWPLGTRKVYKTQACSLTLFISAMSLPSRDPVHHTFVHYPDLIESNWSRPGLMVPASAYPSSRYPSGKVGRYNVKFNGELGASLASVCDSSMAGVTEEKVFEYDVSVLVKPKMRVHWPGYDAEIYTPQSSDIDNPANAKMAYCTGKYVKRFFEERSTSRSSSEEDDPWWLGHYSPEDIIILAVEHVEDRDCKDGEEPDTVLQPILAVRMPTAKGEKTAK